MQDWPKEQGIPPETHVSPWFGQELEDFESFRIFPSGLTAEQMKAIRADFAAQLTARTSSLARLPTGFDQQILDHEIVNDKLALVIDVGGTSLKIHVFRQTQFGLRTTYEFAQPYECVFDKQQWTAQEFFQFIANQVAENVDSDLMDGVNALAFVYSFPGEAVETPDYQVDINPAGYALTKGWAIENLGNQGNVGVQLRRALAQAIPAQANKIQSLATAVMNDTTAVAGEQAGLIVATGMNIAAKVNGALVNLEAGGFDSSLLDKSLLMQFADQDSANFGLQQLEKLIAGQGIENQVRWFVTQAIRNGVMRSDLSALVQTDDLGAMISLILSTENLPSNWSQVENTAKVQLSDQERQCLFALCRRIMDNSARYLASVLVGLFDVVYASDPQDIYTVPTEGSLFWKSPDYVSNVLAAIDELNPAYRIQFTGQDQRMGMVGAATKALQVEARRTELKKQELGRLNTFDYGLSKVGISSDVWNQGGPVLDAVIERADQALAQFRFPNLRRRAIESRHASLWAIVDRGLSTLYGEMESYDLKARLKSRLEAIKAELIAHPETCFQPVREKDNILVVYPDTYGGFDQLTKLVPMFAQMGITKIHVLPPYKAGGDKGFSVEVQSLDQPLAIAKEYGGEQALNQFAQACRESGLEFILDAVLNHIDQGSPIFNQLARDSQSARELVLAWENDKIPFKVRHTEVDAKTGGTYAICEYSDSQGDTHQVRVLIIFPEQVTSKANPLVEVHNMRGEELACYHTFYPFQLDLDLNSPLAFELITNMLIQIADMMGGQGEIRLDAIPFIGKLIDDEHFQHVDTPRALALITLLRTILAMVAPDMRLIAEASRPTETIEEYTGRVGQAYDFISTLAWLYSILTEDPDNFLDQIDEMIAEIGLEGMSRLVMYLKTHDDYPLAETENELIQQLWALLKAKGALAFGINPADDEGLPKGAAISYADLFKDDDGQVNVARQAAHTVLTAFSPHGGFLWFAGTELGMTNDDAALEKERKQAEDEGRAPDLRALNRSAIDPSAYDSDNEFLCRMGEILRARRDYMPDNIRDWGHFTFNGMTCIHIEGNDGQSGHYYNLMLCVNYHDQARELNLEIPDGAECVLTSNNETDNNHLEAYGYKLFRY